MIQAIDTDPEFWHGLTLWGEFGAIQVRGNSGTDALALVVSDTAPRSDEDGRPVLISLDEAIRIRDLLNIATARGFLR